MYASSISSPSTGEKPCATTRALNLTQIPAEFIFRLNTSLKPTTLQPRGIMTSTQTPVRLIDSCSLSRAPNHCSDRGLLTACRYVRGSGSASLAAHHISSSLILHEESQRISLWNFRLQDSDAGRSRHFRYSRYRKRSLFHIPF
jgi:hypothetical protein